MSPNTVLPFRFVTSNATRRDFARHLKSLPMPYRREAVAQAERVGCYPLKAWDSLKAKIAALWNHPRVKSCTETSNVSLAHAIDAVSFNPSCANSALRFLKAAEADQEWNPEAWTA